MLLKAFSFAEHLKANAKTCVYKSDCVTEFKMNAGVSLGVFFFFSFVCVEEFGGRFRYCEKKKTEGP